MNRRGFRELAAALMALSLLLSACGDTGSQSSTTSTSPVPPATATSSTLAATTTSTTPSAATASTTSPATTTPTTIPSTPDRPPGVIRVGMGIDLIFGFQGEDGVIHQPSINPLLAYSDASDLARLVVPGAYRISALTGELEPWLVTNIPRVENGGVVIGSDGTATVTYEIRPEAVWEDGTPITATDLAFTHALVMDEDLSIGHELRRAHDLLDADSIIADGKTFSARLQRPDPRYEFLFQWVLPAHIIDPTTFAEDWNSRLWPSGGPFRWVSYEPPGNPESDPGRIALEANPSYWEVDESGTQLPYLEGIEVLMFTPGAMQWNRTTTWFATGSIDLLTAGVIGPFERESLGDPAELGYVLASEWDAIYEFLFFQLGEARFDVNPESLNEHLRYRQAVLAAIDRLAVAGSDDERVVGSILGTSLPALDHDAWVQYDDRGQAATLLSDLGGELGRDFTAEPPSAVYTTSSADETMRIGDAIAAQLEAAGWTTSTDYDGDYFGAQLPEGLYDLSAVRLGALPGISGLLESLSYLDPSLESGFLVWSEIGEPADRYSQIMLEASTELDGERLAALLTEAETILADQALAYPLILRQRTFRPFWPQRVQGFVPNRAYGWDTWNAAEWRSP